MKTHPITLLGALRSMAISCACVWHEYRCDVRARRQLAHAAKRRQPPKPINFQRSHATWANGNRKRAGFDELKSPAWLALIVFAVVVLVIDLSDSWPAVTAWLEGPAVEIATQLSALPGAAR